MSVIESEARAVHYTNLALGRLVEITEFAPIENSYASMESGNDAMLTDGIIAVASKDSEGWRKFFRGLGREIKVDLGDVFAVNGFETGFLHDRKHFIYCPEKVKLLLSENGTDFYEAVTVEAPYPASFEMCARARYSGKLSYPVRARYAKVVFAVENIVCCDELRITGNACQGYEEAVSGVPVETVAKNRYAARDSLGGIHDIPIFCYGRLGSREFAVKREEFLPYLAYIDGSGKIIDTMFDSVLFVPGRSSPSGASFCFEGTETVLSDWEYLLDELFAEDRNLCALEEAVADVKKVLALPEDYKLKVLITAPVPKISLKPFGDLNGDGIEDKLITTEDCVRAYTRFADEATRRFNGLNFRHIVLEGWMWNSGTLSRERRDDEEAFARMCVEELRKRGYKCLFMPGFQRGGSEKSESVGFDCTAVASFINFDEVLQRNINGALEDYASLCRKYGFGSELEICNGLLLPETSRGFIDILNACLRSFVNNGIMTETVHIYNQRWSNDVIFRCAVSENEEIRGIYDKLYKFIKGTLTESDITAGSEALEPAEEHFSEPAAEEINGTSVEEKPEEPNEEADTVTESKEVQEVAEEFMPEPEMKNPEKRDDFKKVKISPKKTRRSHPRGAKHKKANSCHKKAAIGLAGAAAVIGIFCLVKKAADNGKDKLK